jgi:hypothetical protein
MTVKKYEYLVRTKESLWGYHGMQKLKENLDPLGADGWELVSVSGNLHYFKRSLRGVED